MGAPHGSTRPAGFRSPEPFGFLSHEKIGGIRRAFFVGERPRWPRVAPNRLAVLLCRAPEAFPFGRCKGSVLPSAHPAEGGPLTRGDRRPSGALCDVGGEHRPFGAGGLGSFRRRRFERLPRKGMIRLERCKGKDSR